MDFFFCCCSCSTCCWASIIWVCIVASLYWSSSAIIECIKCNFPVGNTERLMFISPNPLNWARWLASIWIDGGEIWTRRASLVVGKVMSNGCVLVTCALVWLAWATLAWIWLSYTFSSYIPTYTSSSAYFYCTSMVQQSLVANMTVFSISCRPSSINVKTSYLASLKPSSLFSIL